MGAVYSLDGEWEASYGKKRLVVHVPSNWYLEGFDGEELNYLKTFSDPKIGGKRKRLVFEGVDYIAEVKLNGVELGKHEGYFSRFSFDVTDTINEDNVLEVRVKAPKEKVPFPVLINSRSQVKGILQQWDCRPGGRTGQKKGTGGIWKPVYIESFGDYKIENAKVTPDYDGRSVKIDIAITNYEGPENASLKISTAGQDWVENALLRKGSNDMSFSRKVEVEDWWPWDRGAQNLYDVSIQVLKSGEVQDSWRGRFGMRKIEWKNDKLYVNNEKYFLRGTNYCSSQWMSEMGTGEYEKDIGLLKEMNANSIRVHAHVEKKELYETCDEKGILVWQDFPLQWDYISSPSMLKKSKKMMKEMIEDNYNHPSIFLWCCHNEPFLNRFTLDPFLEKEAKKLDETRIVKRSSGWEEHKFAGWYDWIPVIGGDYKNFRSIAEKAHIVSEFGAQALPNEETMKKIFGNDAGNRKKWKHHNHQMEFDKILGKMEGVSLEEEINASQKYQADISKFAIEAMRRKKYDKIAGMFQHMFVDSWPSISWSVMDYWRQPKKAYYAIKDAYSPVLLSIDEGKEPEIWIVNDLSVGFEGTLDYEIELDGNVIEHGKQKVDVRGDSSSAVRKLKKLGKGKYLVRATLRYGKEEHRSAASFSI